MILAGLEGECTALEEHPVAASAAGFLTEKLGVNTTVFSKSLYDENIQWKNSFDYIYCSGVLYHVTDPLLSLRILFCYLKVGGELFIETKSLQGNKALCGYSGISEKGWNWYAPDEATLGRWFVDAGFKSKDVTIFRRSNGRLLGHAVKREISKLPETAGFSRPGSWLESEN